ncbi:hypothetical protein OIDMADRAFT_38923 [Oidiodendron maius Zn]|uniref:Major facilitator superfamily (MFS) profile domain-containing protein n=1 Tax=Oidiodendron maius (strain Zn) TaxID=913774 RepID=A0A0C3HWW7_OIDMZ|nr:hypothetical protein OIDMADRAFT_38923 [Oidiodendron maius Zn]
MGADSHVLEKGPAKTNVGIETQGLSTPPYFIPFLCALITTWIADKTQQRRLMLISISFVATTAGVRYFAVFLATSGVFSTIPNILAWSLIHAPNRQRSDMRRGTSLVLIIVVEPCGSVLSSRIYPTNEGPHFIKGQSVCAAFIFSTTFLAFTLSFLLIRNNMQLGRKQGDVVDRDQRRHYNPFDYSGSRFATLSRSL